MCIYGSQIETKINILQCIFLHAKANYKHVNPSVDMKNREHTVFLKLVEGSWSFPDFHQISVSLS